MCIGIPMRIVEMQGAIAICDNRGRRRTIDMSLVGAQPIGTWLMTFLDAAREVIDADAAARSLAAIEALERVMTGENGSDIDHLFADLIGREPQLPEFLAPAGNNPATKEHGSLMFSPLTRLLVDRHGYPVVTLDTIDAFTAANEHVALFFPGDAERLCESDDVAVVLPELIRQFAGRLVPAVVSRDAEMKLQARYRFNAFPALVFLKRGQYLGVISRIRDWSDYLAEIEELLASEPQSPPPFEFPEGCRTNGLQH